MSSQSTETWRVWGVSLGVALLLSFLGWFSLNQPVLAQSDQPSDTLALIQVNTNNPAINDDGNCSLIEAIQNANADAQVHDDCVAGNGDDTITLQSDAVLLFNTPHNNIGGNNALPVINSNITINGNDATLFRDPNVPVNFRFFNVAPQGRLTLIELGLRNGRADTVGTNQFILSGGAILNRGTLVISDSNLSHNRASFGGAIYSESVTGTLSLADTVFSSNVADLEGGAVYNFSPGSITRGLMRFNHAVVSGGALVHSSSTMTVTDATIRDNTTAGTGAGISAYAVLTDSQIWIRTSTVMSNVASIHGGGLYNSTENGLTSIMQVEGSRIIDNRATSTALGQGLGGGVANGWVQAGSGGVAETRLFQTHVADNVAQSGGGVANVDATGYPTRTARIVLYQSTLARNTAAGVGSERGAGGGLLNRNAVATISNSTISSNQAIGDDTIQGGRGGGIAVVGRGVTTTLQLFNSTIAFNEASQAGGGIAVLGQPVPPPTSMTLGNSLIVSNELTTTISVSNVNVLAAIASPQVIVGTESCSIENGTSDSLGGNIEDGTTCDLDADADQPDTFVQLGPLADNGGPTLTHLISNLGFAFNRALDSICTAAPVNAIDQRGITRPQLGRCDVGAVELEPVPPVIRTTLFPEIYLRYTFQ